MAAGWTRMATTPVELGLLRSSWSSFHWQLGPAELAGPSGFSKLKLLNGPVTTVMWAKAARDVPADSESESVTQPHWHDPSGI